MQNYDYRRRLTYLPGGALAASPGAWPVASVGTSPGTTNLLAWWALDETSGTRQDSHTGNYDMSTWNTPGHTTGKVGNAGTISVTNGSGSYFYFPDGDEVFACPAGSSITVCCWVYFNSMPSNNAYPVNRYGTGVTTSGDWGLNVYNNGRLGFIAHRSGAQTEATTGAGVITATTWYFITGIFNHSVGANGTVYVSANAGTKTSAALTGAKVSGADLYVAIGDLSHTNATYGNMSGAVDEVCIYQRVLSDDEIAWLYNEGSGRAYSEL